MRTQQTLRVQLMTTWSHETSWWSKPLNPRNTLEAEIQRVHAEAVDKTKTKMRLCQWQIIEKKVRQ